MSKSTNPDTNWATPYANWADDALASQIELIQRRMEELRAELALNERDLHEAENETHKRQMARRRPGTYVIKNLAKATPSEIDYRVAALDSQLRGAEASVTMANDALQYALGRTPIRRYRNGRREWALSPYQALDLAAAYAASGTKELGADVPAMEQRLRSAIDHRATIREEMASLHNEYLARRWTRYVGVVGGHVHRGGATRGRDIYCVNNSIRPNSHLAWYPHLSGMDRSEAIAQIEDTMCTHCYPDAPVKAPVADPNVCAGSRKAPREGGRSYGDYQECSECNQTFRPTTSGLIRKHKPWFRSES